MVYRILLLLLLTASATAAQPIPDTLYAPVDSLLVFGWTVDADADRLLVGGWEVRPSNVQRSATLSDPTGTAFVYRRDADGWVVEGRLGGDEIGNQDCFSWSIDLRGDLAAVGAPCEGVVLPDGTVYRGAIYLFRHVDAAWVREAKILSTDVPEPWTSQGYFGRSVSLGDGFLVAGTTFAENPANPDEDWDSGAAYVFASSDGSWQHEATLVNGDTDDVLRERFGISLAVTGVNVLIGASGEGPDISRRGAVYVFRRAGGTWTEQAKLLAHDPTSGTEFGISVAAGNGEVVVASNQAVYPLERSAGSWRVRPSVVADLGPVSLSVARYGDRIVSVDPLYDQTRAMLFVKEAGEWNETDLPLTPIEQWLPEMASVTATHAFVAHPSTNIPSEPSDDFDNYVLIYDLDTATSNESSPERASLALTIAPNPIQKGATVRFTLPKAGSARLVVYDVLGREVLRLVDEPTFSGSHEARFDARGLAAGPYLVRLETVEQTMTRLITVVR